MASFRGSRAPSRVNSVSGSAFGLGSFGETSKNGVEEREVEHKPLFRLDYGSASGMMALRPEGAPPRKTWEADSAFARTNTSLFRLKTVSLPQLHEKPSVRYRKAPTQYNEKELFEHARAQLNHNREDAKDGLKSVGDMSTGVGPSFVSTGLGPSLNTGETFGASVASSTTAGSPAHSALSPGASSAAASPTGSLLDPSAGAKRSKGPQKRSEKYFDLLMKSHYKRVDNWKDEEEAELKQKVEFAAALAARKALLNERRKAAAERAETRSRSSDEESEEDSEVDPEDLVPLQPFDGKMKLEIEISVLRAPDEEEKSEADTSVPPSSSHSSQRRASSSASSVYSRLDLANELDLLKDEMKVDDKPEVQTDSDDDLPDGLRLKKFQDCHDNPNPRWALGIGGTVFFVPDAERYAFGPSMPPPPPASLLGRRRMKMKPRLPLDISNHRYRDEHPNIWPEAPFCPKIDDYLRFEQTLLTLDLYKSCDSAMTQLPKLERASDKDKHRLAFGKIVESQTKRSQAWKNYNLREKLKRKEADRIAREQAARDEAAAREAAIANAASEYTGEDSMPMQALR